MTTYVRPEGDPETAKLAIVGEQPGKTEVFSGRPFCGPSGIELNECLKAVGLTRAECYITNFAKDFDEHVSKYQTLGETVIYSEKGKYYLDLLLNEMRSLKAKAIVAMGGHSMAALTGIGKPGITKMRGSILDNPALPDKLIVPTFHTATVLPPKMVYLNRFLIQFDLKRAKMIAEGKLERKSRKLITKPSYSDAMLYLDLIEKEGLLGAIIYFDIELYNEEVSCISFAYKDDEAISIPFVEQGGDYFSIDQETALWRKVAFILENERIKKCGQNISFDSHFLLRRYGIKCKNLEDTMVAQRVIMPEYSIGLDFITSVWTDHRYYKDEGKKFFGGGGWQQLWQYNATDSLMCAEAFPKQLEKLTQQGNLETYKRQSKLVPPLVYMQERGVRADMEGIVAEYNRILGPNGEFEKLQEELNKVAGQPLNPNSPKQLIDYFYGKAKYKAYKNRKTGKPTTDDTALKRLARRGSKEAKLVQQLRGLRKLASSYLHPDKYDKDGRIRCSFNPVGTKFSRLSSSENIFGTGMNMQNWPHRLLKYLLFDEGYVGYRVDLSQAENRIVAYVGNITPMIECFERGDDVHALTAALIFQKPVSEVTREDGTCPLGDGTHSERFWGKKANHGLNYDLGYSSFALYYEIREREASFIIERYHMAYPGVRNNYHAFVRRMLRENRTITNLLGRRTTFMDKWGDKLFKEAYSCIPQGTVGDIINERGLNYVYYNDEFEPVELLLQVHDDITFQLPKSLGYAEHAKILLKIKTMLETPLTTHDGREFVIPADITICKKSLDKEDSNNALELKSHKIPQDYDSFGRMIEEFTEGEQDG